MLPRMWDRFVEWRRWCRLQRETKETRAFLLRFLKRLRRAGEVEAVMHVNPWGEEIIIRYERRPD